MINLTENAKKHISTLINNEKSGEGLSAPLYLRISIDGGGCAGFQYNFKMDSQKTSEDDVIFPFEMDGTNFNVVVDKTSLPLIENSEIDFKETLTSSSFTVTNPNAASGCGCGTSFSI